jgi:SAM-dependent methyltransferase
VVSLPAAGGEKVSESVPVSRSLEILDTLDWEGLKYEVIKVALELDLFTRIGEGHHTLEDIAEATRSSQRGLQLLLDILCPLGFLNKSGRQYVLTPSSEALFVRGKPTYCAEFYLTLWRSRDRLLEVVKTGKADLDLSDRRREDLWSMYAAREIVIWPQEAQRARQMWQTLGVDKATRPGLHLLDAACGSGIKGFVLAQSDPTARITALDFPKVLEVTARIAEAMGVSQQVTFRSGDMMTADLPADQFDVVQFGAILYYFAPDQVRDVLRKAYQALRSDGLLVIRTLIGDEERCQALEPLLQAVELLYDSPNGRVHTFSEYKDFAAEAGFTEVTRHGEALIAARKR